MQPVDGAELSPGAHFKFSQAGYVDPVIHPAGASQRHPWGGDGRGIAMKHAPKHQKKHQNGGHIFGG